MERDEGGELFPVYGETGHNSSSLASQMSTRSIVKVDKPRRHKQYRCHQGRRYYMVCVDDYLLSRGIRAETPGTHISISGGEIIVSI